MTRTIALTVYLAVILIGASNANSIGMSINAGLLGGFNGSLSNFKTVCEEESGSDAGYQKLTSSFFPMIRCVSERLDIAQFVKVLSKSPKTVEDRQAVVEYCPAISESVDCLDDVLEGAAMCGNDKVSVLKPMYRDNGKVFHEFDSPEYRSCSQQANVQQCEVSNFNWNKPISQVGEEGCREMREQKQCTHEAVSSTCSNSAYEQILNATLEPYIEAANCTQDV